MEAIELVKYKGAKSVLETLLKFPKRQFSINELAKTSEIPFSSCWRLVRKWEPAGIIETGRLGKSVTVKLRQSGYAKRAAELVKLSASPQAFAVEALKKMLKKTRGVKEVFLFGSVAKGEEKLESDVDLAVLAGREFDADALVFSVYEKLGAKVVPLVFRRKKEFSAFLRGKEAVSLL